MKAYLSLLARRPDFRRLWAADVASALGTWMSYIAISVLVVQQDGSAVALALVFVVHTLPHALLAPIAASAPSTCCCRPSGWPWAPS